MPSDDFRQGGLCRPPYSLTSLSVWSFNVRRHTLTRIVPCLQMSSKGSSGRVDLVNAFEGDSSSSSNPGGKQTPKFSCMDSSRWESASLQDNVVEGSSRPVGECGVDKASSSGHVEWSCS